MSQSILKRIRILVVLVLMATSIALTPTSGMGLDVSPSGFLLQEGDILAFEVVHTSENGSPGLTIELQDGENVYNTSLDAGEEVGFGIETLPDWGANTSSPAILGGSTNGGDFTLEYPAPFAIAGIADAEGAAFLMPVITIGDNSYWTDFDNAASNNGFIVTSTATYFSLSMTDGADFLNVTWTKADGVLHHYRYEYQENTVDKVLELVRADWDLIVSQATTLEFSTTTPLLDYQVTEAEFGDLVNAFNFSAIEIDGSGEDGPLDAHGMFYVGDHVQVQIDEHRTDDTMGYLLGLNAENGYIDFNITIELPDENPQMNNMFLYPQFLVADTNIIDGYLHVAEFMSESYSTYITANHFGINFAHVNGSIDVEWELATGFMTSWKMNNTVEDQVLALDLIASAAVEDFDINYDHVVADEGNLYKFVQISIEGQDDVIPLDEDESNPGVGYIGVGDEVYVNPLMASVTLDDAPPTVFYDIEGPNGNQQNISIQMNYPGFDQVDPNGPPLLNFHYLGGNVQFFNWVELLYDATGGDFIANGTHYIISFSNADVTFEEVFRADDLVMVSYYYENTEQGVLLEITHISDEVISSIVDEISETPDGLELPAFDSITGFALMAFFVAIPILRRK